MTHYTARKESGTYARQLSKSEDQNVGTYRSDSRCDEIEQPQRYEQGASGDMTQGN